MAARPPYLVHLEYLGDAAQFSAQIDALLPNSSLLGHFSNVEVRELARYMNVYRAASGAEIVREGEGGDFMLLVLEGGVEVRKRDRRNEQRPIAQAEPGRALGEMSLIDGEPRFATCVTTASTLLAVLDRESLARIIVEQPVLGAKVLTALVLMLSKRLRATSARLLALLEAQSQHLMDLP